MLQVNVVRQKTPAGAARHRAPSPSMMLFPAPMRPEKCSENEAEKKDSLKTCEQCDYASSSSRPAAATMARICRVQLQSTDAHEKISDEERRKGGRKEKGKSERHVAAMTSPNRVTIYVT